MDSLMESFIEVFSKNPMPLDQLKNRLYELQTKDLPEKTETKWLMEFRESMWNAKINAIKYLIDKGI
jgi:hypothetical protein